MQKNLVIGFLGTTLDAGATDKRWERWRPSVSLCAHADFPIDRLVLLYTKNSQRELGQLVQADIATLSPATEVELRHLPLTDPWDFPQVYAALHEFARHYPLDEHSNVYVHLTTGTHIAQICLFLLTEARYFPAKLVDTSLDRSAEEKWRGKLDIIDLNLASYDLLASRFSNERHDSETLLKGGIATRNRAFNQLITDIEKVSLRSTAPMLLTGPTGAGKSQLAQRIYDLRRRRHRVTGRFVEVNCATLRGENAMSALFGHKKGAFTGAVADRPGYLLAAQAGILFLDEIGELGLDEQAMLLRALEDKRFFPLGSDKEVGSDFQLLAGTNRDLAAEVAKGTFRADLYARINLWTFRLPGLAERREDIEPNLDYELERCSIELNSQVSFNREARQAYLDFALQAPWPGNFRDLSASLMRMATLAEGGRIVPEDVALELQRLRSTWAVATPLVSVTAPGLVNRVLAGRELDPFDAAQLERVLAVVVQSRSLAEAGRQLFAVSRLAKKSVNDSHRLRLYLDGWGLTFDDVKRALA